MKYLTVALAKGRLAELAMDMFLELGMDCSEMKEKTFITNPGQLINIISPIPRIAVWHNCNNKRLFLFFINPLITIPSEPMNITMFPIKIISQHLLFGNFW